MTTGDTGADTSYAEHLQAALTELASAYPGMADQSVLDQRNIDPSEAKAWLQVILGSHPDEWEFWAIAGAAHGISVLRRAGLTPDDLAVAVRPWPSAHRNVAVTAVTEFVRALAEPTDPDLTSQWLRRGVVFETSPEHPNRAALVVTEFSPLGEWAPLAWAAGFGPSEAAAIFATDPRAADVTRMLASLR